MVIPDVFAIRRCSVESNIDPAEHASRDRCADLLGDLRKAAKRAAYLSMASACWHVLGEGVNRRPIAQSEEVHPDCGVLQLSGDSSVLARSALRRAFDRLPSHMWMALALGNSPAQSATDGQAQR